jgi:hypothetical protein
LQNKQIYEIKGKQTNTLMSPGFYERERLSREKGREMGFFFPENVSISWRNTDAGFFSRADAETKPL